MQGKVDLRSLVLHIIPLIFSTDLTDQVHDISSDGVVGRSLTEQR